MAASDRPAASSTVYPRRILIFRALQVGDMLCAVPALRALRAAFPDAHITLAGLPWAAAFARRFSGYLDDFIPFPGHPQFPEQPADSGCIDTFVNEVSRRRFDLALQLHGSGEISNAILARLGAGHCVAFGRLKAALGFSLLRYPTRGHEIDRLLALVRFAVATICGKTIAELLDASFSSELEFPVTVDDIAELKRRRLNLRRHDYLCLHPGARDRSKCWPAKHFAQIARQLSIETGLQIVLTGSAAERDLADDVCAVMRRPAINAACDMSLGALAALLNDARLLICNDTAVSHIAAALKVPSVVIFQRSDPGRWAPRNRALHQAVRDPCKAVPGAVLAAAREMLGATSNVASCAAMAYADR